MPPLFPRPALLPRSITSTCSSSSASPRAAAAFFSSTPSSRQQPRPPPRQQIPPESPLFINVPNPPQDQSIEALRELKPVKGHLPIPRRIFKQQQRGAAPSGDHQRQQPHPKTTAEFLALSAPEPTSARSQAPAASEQQAWKRRIAADRRASLGSGLRELWARKALRDGRRQRDRAAKLAANRAAAVAPEREDERLTRASVGAATLATAVRPDPLRFERAAASAARTAALLAERSERRRGAVQELYMSAARGPFIVDDAGLEAAVEREFGEDKFRGRSSVNQAITSIWDLEGPPVSVADMLREVSGRDSRIVLDLNTQKAKTEKRQKRVAEELTGGRID